MEEIQCPNCKERYRFVKSDEKDFKFLYVHDSKGCPYGLFAYHDSKKLCRESALNHIKNKFTWVKIPVDKKVKIKKSKHVFVTVDNDHNIEFFKDKKSVLNFLLSQGYTYKDFNGDIYLKEDIINLMGTHESLYLPVVGKRKGFQVKKFEV